MPSGTVRSSCDISLRQRSAKCAKCGCPHENLCREPAVVFDHDGHHFECRLEFLAWEDFRDRTIVHCEAQWRISMDGVHITDYQAYVNENADGIRSRFIRVWELRKVLDSE